MTVSSPAPADRLCLLRSELARLGLDGFIVPRADEHQGEYVPPRAERLAWLTGFTGSAGVAVVLAEKAALFVDGRYTLQASREVDTEAFEILHVTDTPPHDWLAEQAMPGARIGYDAWLHTPDDVARLGKALEGRGSRLLPVADGSNPVDTVWPDQPDVPLAPVTPHTAEYAGKSVEKKLSEVVEALRRQRRTLPSSPRRTASRGC